MALISNRFRSSDSRPAIDLVIHLAKGAELGDLISQRGSLFEEWVDAWNWLAKSEKDSFAHPVWIASLLAAFTLESPERCGVMCAGAISGI